ELPQNPGQGRNAEENAYREHERHSQEDLPESVSTGIRAAIREDQVHGLLAFFDLQVGEKTQQVVGLVGRSVKLLAGIQAIEPVEIARANPAGTVIDHDRLLRTVGHTLHLSRWLLRTPLPQFPCKIDGSPDSAGQARGAGAGPGGSTSGSADRTCWRVTKKNTAVPGGE